MVETSLTIELEIISIFKTWHFSKQISALQIEFYPHRLEIEDLTEREDPPSLTL